MFYGFHTAAYKIFGNLGQFWTDVCRIDSPLRIISQPAAYGGMFDSFFLAVSLLPETVLKGAGIMKTKMRFPRMARKWAFGAWPLESRRVQLQPQAVIEEADFYYP